MIVAIDGPAGTGKGTVAKAIAKEFNLVNIDTGATYRCVALEVLRRGLSLEDTDKIIEISAKMKIDMDQNGNVFLNGKNVTKEIRSKEVTDMVAPVSLITEVRLNLVKMQRELAEGKDIVMEGRDITTYVFPNAEVKIYLDADVEERAKRRYKENLEKGISTTYEDVLKNITDRDEYEKHKEIGSLTIAPGATVIDTTHITIDQVVNKVKEIIIQKTRREWWKH